MVETVRGVARERVVRTTMWGLRRSGDLGVRLLDERVRRDPYAHYRRIREHGPLYSSRLGLMTASHATVERVLRDPRFGHGPQQQPRNTFERALQPPRPADLVGAIGPDSMIMMDPPDHTRLRRLVSKAFTPRTVERLRPRVCRLAEELLDRALARGGGFDLIRDLAAPLPMMVICEVLGVPLADRRRFKQWGTDLAPALDLTPTYSTHMRAQAAMRELNGYFEQLFAQRRAEPGEDVISALLAVEEEGDHLTHRELLATCSLLLLAGFETTVNLVGNGALALAQHRDQLAQVQQQPALLPNAVEEMLRYDPSVQLTSRVALVDVDLDGTPISAGQSVIVLLGGANRDPAVFDAPDRFDVTRSNARRHLAFAAGAHHCLGAALARLEAEVTFGVLLDRLGDLVLDGATRRRPTFILRGLAQLPLHTPAVRAA